MDTSIAAVARGCLTATHDVSLSFPDVIGKLQEAGFEGYAVDYRRGVQSFYLPDGDSLELPLPQQTGPVAAQFDITTMAAQIRWAQSDDPAYSYPAFSEKITTAGCAGYLVSFPGRRVVYYGRTGETHTELFPQ